MSTDYPMSIDTATEILGYFIAKEMNRFTLAVDPEEKKGNRKLHQIATI